MELTVFAKKKTTRDGKPFTTYVSKLHRREGGDVYVEVRFKRDCPLPPSFPCVIEVPRDYASMSERNVTREDGTVFTSRRLYVGAWNSTGKTYVDHSLDEFED